MQPASGRPGHSGRFPSWLLSYPSIVIASLELHCWQFLRGTHLIWCPVHFPYSYRKACLCRWSAVLYWVGGLSSSSVASCFTLHVALCLHAQSLSCICDPTDCSPPGSSVHGISQARILEWLPFPTPGDLPDPGIEPESLASPALAGGFSNLLIPSEEFQTCGCLHISNLSWLDGLWEQRVISVTAPDTQASQASVATAMNENPNFVALLPVLEFIFLFNFSYQTKVVFYCCFF